MSMLLIPVTANTPFQTSKVRLEGVDYIFQMNWNQREARWYVSIQDDEENPILSGLKLVTPFWPLLGAYRFDPRVPPGELFFSNLTNIPGPPGLGDLGIGLRCELTYRESA